MAHAGKKSSVVANLYDFVRLSTSWGARGGSAARVNQSHQQLITPTGLKEFILARAGEWAQYSTSHPAGAEYLAICLPAFAKETVHRDAP